MTGLDRRSVGPPSTQPRGQAEPPGSVNPARRLRLPAIALVCALACLAALFALTRSNDEPSVRVAQDRSTSDGDGESTHEPNPSNATSDRRDAATATAVVSGFLDDLRGRDYEAAARRWTGYPELPPDASSASKKRFLEELLSDADIMRLLESSPRTFETASTSEGMPVVTVSAPGETGKPPAAVAFLTGFSRERADSKTFMILRLPASDRTGRSPSSSAVEEGDQIEFPGVPVEGGARAYVDGAEVPVGVDHVSTVLRVNLPAGVRGDVVITLSMASPELPTVYAFPITIGSP